MQIPMQWRDVIGMLLRKKTRLELSKRAGIHALSSPIPLRRPCLRGWWRQSWIQCTVCVVELHVGWVCRRHWSLPHGRILMMPDARQQVFGVARMPCVAIIFAKDPPQCTSQLSATRMISFQAIGHNKKLASHVLARLGRPCRMAIQRTATPWQVFFADSARCWAELNDSHPHLHTSKP